MSVKKQFGTFAGVFTPSILTILGVILYMRLGWVVGNAAHLDRKDRLIVTIAAVIPDVDGAGIIAETMTRSSERPLLWWSEYHHVLAHNLGFALLVTMVSLLLAKQKAKAATLAAISFHLHLLADLVGARGPDGYQWPIPYLLPFSEVWQWTWTGQWELNAWPNFAITLALLAMTFRLAWKRGYSPLEIISTRADEAFVATLRKRFPYR